MSESKEDKFFLIYIAMIYIGLYMFMYGLIKERATRWRTKAMGWIATWAILISATMMLYDRSLDKPKPQTYVDEVVISAYKANIRSSETTRSKDNIVGQESRGKKLVFVSREKHWICILYKDSFAYVHSSVVNISYEVAPATYRWPNLGLFMIFFAVLYVFALVNAIREGRAMYRFMAEI